MINVLANNHAYLTSFLNMDAGNSAGQHDTNVSGGSDDSQTGECALW